MVHGSGHDGRRSYGISNTILRTITQSRTEPLRATPGNILSAHIRVWWRHRSVRRRALRIGLVVANVSLLVAVIWVVADHPTRASGSSQPVIDAATAQTAVQPVDQLASVTIAETVARMTNVIEAPAVTSQVNSEKIQLAITSTSSTVINKPQTVSSAFVSNKDIKHYVTQPGDSVSSLAAKFSVSSNSIMWSNGLIVNYLMAGQTLVIPPVNGVVYTVRAGDTPASLAQKFQANQDKIIALNDAEISGLHVGEQVIIPDGMLVLAPSYTSSYASGFAWGAGAIYGFNGYDWGNCTWYVATQIAVPANWGNAATWAAGARAAGWRVSPVPSVGAIAQTPYAAGGLGHVAIVDAVSADGKQVLIRDMNGIAGFARVGTAWESTATYPNYITRN